MALTGAIAEKIFFRIEKGKSIDELLLALWHDYKSDPVDGVNKDEVYSMVKELVLP